MKGTVLRKSTTGGVVRRNITLPENVADTMAKIREETGAQSDSEVIRQACKLYKYILDNGGEAFIRDKVSGEERTIVAV